MDSFLNTLRNTFGWLLHKRERPIHRVLDWLKDNDLEEYFTKFEVYGWDKLSVLPDMTDSDIEMCIHKPGHKAKFKRALTNLKCKLDKPSGVPRPYGQNTAYQETVETAITEHAPISEASRPDEEKDYAEEPKQETGSLDRQYDIGVKSDNTQSESESDQESFFDIEESFIGDLKNSDESVTNISEELSSDDNNEAAEKPTILLEDIGNHHAVDNIMQPNNDNEECLQAEMDIAETL